MKLTLIMLSILLASAIGQRGVAMGLDDCEKDLEKFCKNVKPGNDRLVKCLEQNKAKLSFWCKNRDGEWTRTCKEDITKHCKSVNPGGGRVMTCLKGAVALLSKDCKDTVSGAP